MMDKNIARSTFISTFTIPKSNQKHILDEKFKKEPKGSVYLDAIQAICDHRAKKTSKENHEPEIFIEIKNFQLESHVATLHMLKSTKPKTRTMKTIITVLVLYSILLCYSVPFQKLLLPF